MLFIPRPISQGLSTNIVIYWGLSTNIGMGGLHILVGFSVKHIRFSYKRRLGLHNSTKPVGIKIVMTFNICMSPATTPQPGPTTWLTVRYHASALIRLVAKMNHSCRPNCDVDFPGGGARAVVRARRDIAAGSGPARRLGAPRTILSALTFM